ncbi:MAG TPA: MFS transporter [Dehalococcoidia bacterium]|nr:MFS transporter [Dehalococcoidia bacterium]
MAWAMYDFANTIFSMNVLTLYFALWVTQDRGAPQIVFSLALSGSMLVVALTSPMFGAVSDRFGRRIPFLTAFVLICVAFTAAIGQTGGLMVALVFFAIANYAYQTGNVFYDALLPTVSQEHNRGRISGLGVGLGYVGTIAGILMVAPFVNHWGRGAAFLPTAVLFLLFALPCFLLVKESPSAVPWSAGLIKDGYSQLFRTLRHARHHSNLLTFIAARFLYVDAVNTLLIFMAVYVTRVIGFNDDQVRLLLIVSTTFAIVGAFLYGRVVDRLGPKKTLTVVLIQWAAVFVIAATTFYPPIFWVAGALAGIALGGTWTADRAFLTRLAPPEQMGEFFGLYQLAGRFAAVTGPLIWGFTTDLLSAYEPWNFRIGILMLLLNLVLGFMVLTRVSDTHISIAAGGTPQLLGETRDNIDSSGERH